MHSIEKVRAEYRWDNFFRVELRFIIVLVTLIVYSLLAYFLSNWLAKCETFIDIGNTTDFYDDGFQLVEMTSTTPRFQICKTKTELQTNTTVLVYSALKQKCKLLTNEPFEIDYYISELSSDKLQCPSGTFAYCVALIGVFTIILNLSPIGHIRPFARYIMSRTDIPTNKKDSIIRSSTIRVDLNKLKNCQHEAVMKFAPLFINFSLNYQPHLSIQKMRNDMYIDASIFSTATYLSLPNLHDYPRAYAIMDESLRSLIPENAIASDV